MQVRYQADDNSEIFLFTNSNLKDGFETMLNFTPAITEGRKGWVWDPETGARFRLNSPVKNEYLLTLGAAESRVLVFDTDRRGKTWNPVSTGGRTAEMLEGPWHLEFIHSRGDKADPLLLDTLRDLKDLKDYSSFSGTIVYKTKLILENRIPTLLDTGNVEGVTLLKINGVDCGVKWYGERIYEVGKVLGDGINILEIRVITLMGNYMKSLTGNQNAQYWTNLGRKNQPMLQTGLRGPVMVYY